MQGFENNIITDKCGGAAEHHFPNVHMIGKVELQKPWKLK